MKRFKDIVQCVSLFLLVVIYSINLYFALTMQGPYWNMWVTITTAGIGAGLPVWLVWKLSSEREYKETRRQKRFYLLQEYYNTFHNVICLTRYRILCEKNKEKTEELNYYSHPFPKILDISEVTSYELTLTDKKYTAIGISSLLTKFFQEFNTNTKIDKVSLLQDFLHIEIYWMMLIANVLSVFDCDVRQDMDVESFIKELDIVQHKYNRKAGENNVSTEKLSK